MSVPHALMGVLAKGPRYGYELRRGLEEELGPEWRLDFGQLYRALGSLAGRGWVSFRVAPGEGGPQRKIYALTAAGRREMERWLREAEPGPPRRRDSAAVKARLGPSMRSGARSATRGARHPEPATLLAVGCDDPLLGLLAQRLAPQHTDIRFATQPVCSLAGLIALYERRAHVAAIHLLDVDSGEYNTPYVKHLLPDEKVVLVNVARREQGLMLAAGNPRDIRGLRDLTRRGIRVVNRQSGAGTRLLLRHLLRRARVDPRRIAGYDEELPSHGAVAARIAAGEADAGPGLRAVAEAHGLDFLPLGEERYDLALRRQTFESPQLRPLLELLHDTAFRREGAHLPGYDVTRMSRVVATIE